jgi:hypothetical protein
MASIINITRGDPTVVNRYLADQLGEAERLAFEEEMLRDPEVLKEVEATARFKAGLMQLRATGELAALQAPGTARLRLAFAAAAVLAMLVIGLGVQQWQGRGSRMLLAGAPLSLPSGRVYTLFSTRSQGADLVIDLPPVRRALQLRVLPDIGDERSHFRAALSAEGAAATSAAIVEDLQPGADGFVTLFVDSGRLVPGRYRLTLEQTGDTAGSAETGAAETVGAAGTAAFTLEIRPAGTSP